MRTRLIAAVGTAALVASLAAVPAATAASPDLRLSEVRIDQPSTDVDEYAEIEADEGTDLAGFWLLTIGEGTGGSGVVESVVELSGVVDASRTFVVAEQSFTLGGADLVASLNFENSDNVTHLLVEGFTGSVGQDLDHDDDGSLDTLPWAGVVDAIGLVESPAGGDRYYGASLGFEDLGPDGSFVPGHAYRDVNGAWTIGAFDAGQTDTPGVVPNEPGGGAAECDATEITLVSEVQGRGRTSPLAGDTVTVRAVVTLVAPGLGGYFVQEEADDVDDDPATSEGLFVEGVAPDGLASGDTVEVSGDVAEDSGRTQIDVDQTAVCDVASTTIDPTPLTMPATTAQRETREGMLVTTTQDLYVTSLFTAYRFGELGVAPDGPLVQPTSESAPDDPRAQQLAEQNADSLLFINDRDEFGNDNAPWFHDVRRLAGDVVAAGVVGALNYSFGDFLVEPVGEFPDIVQVESRPDAPALDGGHDIGAFNVLNYFNTFGDSSVLRGAQSPEEFELQSTKIVAAITALDPAVLGIIEVENDYEDHYDDDPDTVPSMQTLVDRLNAVAGAGTYDWVVPDEDDLVDEGLGGGGLGTDAIAVGIIYQPDRATEVGDPATFDIDAQLTERTELEDAETGEVEENESFSNGDKNRWPLAQTFRVKGRDMTVVVNHLKSKGSSCRFVDGPTFDPRDDVGSDLTGNCDLTRTYGARRLVEWVDDHPTGIATSNAFVVGDLNSYEEETPIEVLVDAGYVDLVEELGDDAATYKFDGRYGRLDYVMASSAATALVRDTAVWQANSPEPYGYLYDNDPVDATAYASSDHDPVVVSLQPSGPPDRVGPPPWAPARGR